jgi:hypothetical protein
MGDNLLILDFDDGLKIEEKFSSYKINSTNRSIKKIRQKYLNSERLWDFKKNLSYVEIEDIIKHLRRYSDREGIEFQISASVISFIQYSKFEIEEIAKRGLKIKENKDSYFDEFQQFVKIVNEQVSRPLYEIQNRVSFYQAIMNRVANFSVPGAGKTSMVYGTYAYLSSESINKVDKIVVIGPKNSFLSWKEEFKNVFGNKRELRVIDIHNSDFRREMLYKNVQHYNLFLFNYEAIVSYRYELEKIIDDRTMLVFDEVHKIKRVNSERSLIAIELAQLTNFRYVLTGTPIPNSYSDIWNFLNILYKDEYRKYFSISLPMLNNPSELLKEEINNKLFPFFWRVTKHELGVPPENPDYICDIIANQNEQQLINLLWRKYSRNPFQLYIRLIQLSSNPSLLKNSLTEEMYAGYGEDSLEIDFLPLQDSPSYSDSELSLIDAIGESSKFLSCMRLSVNLIKENRIHIIWCLFVDTIFKVQNHLNELGYKVAVVYGGIESEERERIILDFQKGIYDVLVTNPHTLAESVSLHMISHDAIYLEYSFNLTHMLQSRDRIHRLGLNKGQETNYYYFCLNGQPESRSTIDKKIYNKLNEKKEIMLKAIERTSLSVEYTIDEKAEILQIMQEDHFEQKYTDRKDMFEEGSETSELARANIIKTIQEIERQNIVILEKIQKFSDRREELITSQEIYIKRFSDVVDGYYKIIENPNLVENSEQRLEDAETIIVNFYDQQIAILKMLNNNELREFDISLKLLKEDNIDLL